MITSTYKAAVTPFFSGEEATFASVLLSVCVKLYGPACLEWDPLTLETQLEDDLGVQIPRIVYDQLMGLVTALGSDVVYRDVPAFDTYVGAVCRNGALKYNDAPAVDDVAWAVMELQLNDPEPSGRNSAQPFGKDIQRYVRVVLDEEGLMVPPKVLAFASERTVGRDQVDDPAAYAAAYGTAQAAAAEVDEITNKRVLIMLQHLQRVGVDISTLVEHLK